MIKFKKNNEIQTSPEVMKDYPYHLFVSIFDNIFVVAVVIIMATVFGGHEFGTSCGLSSEEIASHVP